MKIFISYRRDDSGGHAGRLYDHLKAHFGQEHIFMDIDAIQPGEDFRKAIDKAVGSCDVVLVMIGKGWVNAADAQGKPRLEQPGDFVLAEIATALTNPKTTVIPVLVRGAVMPTENELPVVLKELAWRNAVELSDNRFQYDANQLIKVIEKAGAGERRKIGAARFWGIAAGVVILSLFLIIGFYIIPLSIFQTPTPIYTPPSKWPTQPLPASSTPTSELLSTPTATFPLQVRKLEARDMHDVNSIWIENNIKLKDMNSPGKVTYSGSVRAGQEYHYSIYWCATNTQKLNENMDKIRITFYVNGEPIPEEMLYIYDRDTEDGNWKCRYQVAALSGWIPNEIYQLEVKQNILTKISDGQTSYPPGEYVRELDVTAE